MAIYLANNQTKKASDMIGAYPSDYLPTAFIDFTSKIARESKDSSIPLSDRVESLVLTGKFSQAGDLIVNNLRGQPSSDMKLVADAYYAYSASGKMKKADEVRTQFGFDPPSSPKIVNSGTFASQRLVESIIRSEDTPTITKVRDNIVNSLIGDPISQ